MAKKARDPISDEIMTGRPHIIGIGNLRERMTRISLDELDGDGGGLRWQVGIGNALQQQLDHVFTQLFRKLSLDRYDHGSDHHPCTFVEQECERQAQSSDASDDAQRELVVFGLKAHIEVDSKSVHHGFGAYHRQTHVAGTYSTSATRGRAQPSESLAPERYHELRSAMEAGVDRYLDARAVQPLQLHHSSKALRWA